MDYNNTQLKLIEKQMLKGASPLKFNQGTNDHPKNFSSLYVGQKTNIGKFFNLLYDSPPPPFGGELEEANHPTHLLHFS
jgi:hypothetical protein